MSELKYKTRGNTNPHGKPRVYFCCHPEDFDRCFEPISDEILSKQNCTVYYFDPSADINMDELALDLGQMQLFVMPVTYRLLHSQNRALDVEFRFAMDNRIPVLPLMQDTGMDELFNEKCGDLQFLDKFNRDLTSISYDEKLERYLNTVLIGDEFADKIRSAFDAYVFLSYRKKDRKYANELMRLIHRNEFCRDIAIWYDEFLIPGESWTDAIKNALDKSELFALAVTPNLLEKGNYIMTTEYPMAQDAKKRILPVQMKKTNRFRLRRRFRKLPQCTDGYDESALADALMQSIERISKKENDNSPEHCFFIGLAYLGGIDVEVDHDRAVKLITWAAEAGLEEAADKLMLMYQNGEGVPRSYTHAVKWRERKIAIMEERCKTENTEDSAIDHFLEVTFCGDDYKQMKDLPTARAKYLYAKELAEAFNQKYATDRTKRSLSLILERFGALCMEEGDTAGAEEYFRQVLSIREELNRAQSTVGSEFELIRCFMWLGSVRENESDLTGSAEYFKKALASLEKISDQTDPAGILNDMGICLQRLGDISVSEGRIAEAKEYYSQALAIDEQLDRELGTAGAHHGLMVSLIKLGDICDIEGDRSEAKRYYTKALNTIELVNKKTGTPGARRSLSSCIGKLAEIYIEENDLERANEYCQRACELDKTAYCESGTVESQRDLVVSHLRMGRIHMKLNDNTSAIYCFIDAEDLAKGLVERTRSVDSKRVLAAVYNNYYHAVKANSVTKNTEVFKEHLMKEFVLTEEIARETGSVEDRLSLAASYISLGTLCKNDQPEEAKTALGKAIPILEDLMEVTEFPACRREYAICHQALGEIAKAEEDLPEAHRHFDKAYTLTKAIDLMKDTPESNFDLAVAVYNLGEVTSAEGDKDTARNHLEESRILHEAIVEKYRSPAVRESLASVYLSLCGINEKEKEYSRECFSKALGIYKELCDEFPDNLNYLTGLLIYSTAETYLQDYLN